MVNVTCKNIAVGGKTCLGSSMLGTITTDSQVIILIFFE